MLENFDVSKPDFERARDTIISVLEMGLVSSKSAPNLFLDLNQILTESIVSDLPTVLCDMPELLLRWQLAERHSLDEFKEIFNSIMNKIARKDGPLLSHAAAMYHYPEVF